MSEDLFPIPKELKTVSSVRNFEENFYGKHGDGYTDFEKIQMKRAISGGKLYTRLNSSLWVAGFMNIPYELIGSVEFVDNNKLVITFFETVEFSIEKYFEINSDLIKNEIFSIKYLDKEGNFIRTDDYTISEIGSIAKDPITREMKDLTIKITLYYKKHDISTCKE